MLFVSAQNRRVWKTWTRTGYNGAAGLCDLAPEASRKVKLGIGDKPSSRTHHADLDFHTCGSTNCT